MVRGRNKNYIKLLSVILEYLTPVGITFCTFPASFAMNTAPPAFINFGKSNTLQTFIVEAGSDLPLQHGRTSLVDGVKSTGRFSRHAGTGTQTR